MRASRAAIAGAVFVLAVSCSREEPAELVLPRTPIVTIRAGYALVLPDYVRVFPEPAPDGKIDFFLRQGDIVEVVSESDRRDWSKVRAGERVGWVEARHIRPFASRAQATNARGTYLDDAH